MSSSMSTPLRECLKARGHGALQWLHDETGIPLRSLYRYVDAKREPPLHHAVAISKATGVRVEDMVKPTVATTSTDASPEADQAAE